MKVRLLDAIEFNNSKSSYACGGKIERGRRAKSACADKENARRFQAALSFDAESRQSELPAIPRKLVGAEVGETSL